MTLKIEGFAAKALWAMTVLIAFLLAFESHLSLPLWLQAAGRMHPLLLHFPIVLILASVLSGLLERRPLTPGWTRLTEILWLCSALTAGITVLMGLFLSREEGYAGNTLNWHKWTGAATFFMAAFCYWFRQNKIAKLPAGPLYVLSACLVVVSGHFGAELTHGEGFISEPLRRNTETQNVPIDQALVFDHVVSPILEAKCTGCHNTEKAKGKLVLTDSSAIVKGGKNGAVITAFQPDASPLIERLHLSPDDKKHMPPKGKPQLTPDEEAILVAWIKAGTPYRLKVTALSHQDTLGLLAQKKFSRPSVEEPLPDFEAADASVIEKLNHEYRTVAPLSFGSPALSVDIYGSQAYTPKTLEELDPIKKQVVALNLSRMPVSDADLKQVAGFQNLRKVNLNFTGITAKGLEQLTALKHLQTLYLAGTKITSEGLLQFLSKARKVRSVILWDTGIAADQIANIRKTYPGVALTGDFSTNDTTRLKLNKPLAKSDQWVFDEKTSVRVYHPVRDVKLLYTTDGSDPDSLSKTASEPIVLNSPTRLRVRAYKEGWLPSDVAEFQVFRNSFRPDSVFLLNRLNRVHLAEGAHTFFDRQLGAIGANNPAWANYFAGVRNTDLQLLCWFNTPVPLKTVGIRLMVEEETGIYPPAVIEIWGGENEDKLKLLAKDIKPDLPEPREKPTLRKIELPVHTTVPPKCLKIVVKPFQRPNEGPKLVLIDEMFLN
ncbi:chitobiase/beta-hexosaminidase C-terminal domain-containing protein [Ravibacter arvi]|uniref:Chitobiase/beta-hexosaminidase C-terminal domain-containing protein n=1 Tax=Ravibacter arvi TaxID=2051041 RepID=A0ABP8LNT2_9BACT